MKFEIAVNGYIFPELPIVQLGANQPRLECADFKQLEEILQAVKKTQEKLVNKQIQNIQDSKNNVFTEPQPPYTEEQYRKLQEIAYPNITKEKIEENQKMILKFIEEILGYHVDLGLELIKYDQVLSDDAKKILQNFQKRLNDIVKNTTGKDLDEFVKK